MNQVQSIASSCEGVLQAKKTVSHHPKGRSWFPSSIVSMDYQAVEYVDIRETEMRPRPFAWRGVEEKLRVTNTSRIRMHIPFRCDEE